jgi:hypothetical protein
MKALFPTLLFCTALATAQTQLRFTEILLDPAGPNTGFQLIEVHNIGNQPADLTGWQLVTPSGTYGLPPVTVPVGVFTLLHVAASGTSTPTDLYLPTMPALGTTGSLALFRSAATSNPTAIVDFVSWGGGQGAIAVAMVANRWTNTSDTVQVPATQGATMAHYDQHAYGSNLGSESWFTDRTPTLGGPNDGGAIYAAYYGCPQMLAPPQIGTGENDNRPWIGETWRLDTSYLPTLPTWMWVGIGLQPFAPLPLDPFGIPGCLWSASPDLVFAVNVQGYPWPIHVQVPPLSLLIGYQLEVQALVAAPTANAAGLLPTRVMFGFPGSR